MEDLKYARFRISSFSSRINSTVYRLYNYINNNVLYFIYSRMDTGNKRQEGRLMNYEKIIDFVLCLIGIIYVIQFLRILMGRDNG